MDHIAAAVSLLDVATITLVNLLYLLTQVVIAADDCDVWPAVQRVVRLIVAAPRALVTVFGIVLVLVVLGTAASVLATAALGLIAFVPFLGLAALPLQLAAWLLRGSGRSEFLGLAALAAYLRVYRLTRGELANCARPGAARRRTAPHDHAIAARSCRRRRAPTKNRPSAGRHPCRPGPGAGAVRRRRPRPGAVPVGTPARHRRGLLAARDDRYAAVRVRRAATGR